MSDVSHKIPSIRGRTKPADKLQVDSLKPKKCASLQGAVSEPSKVKIQSQSLYKTRKLTIHELKKKASIIWFYTEGGCNTVKEGNEYLSEISKIVDEIVTIEDVATRIQNG